MVARRPVRWVELLPLETFTDPHRRNWDSSLRPYGRPTCSTYVRSHCFVVSQRFKVSKWYRGE